MIIVDELPFKFIHVAMYPRRRRAAEVLKKGTISFPRTNFLEMDAMFLEFANDLDNLAGGSSSVGDNLGRLLNYLQLKLLGDVRSLDS
ncbi:gamma-aminobutyrate transaminase POP2 [Cucumis melo var. makuwa]|uniref:Gamma-aminobutyrate transaminase POP2 n=1 Tax=Cucumis melo var. makuwa TaxID=1194695 RepID=A0A5A7TTU7_CUCMM|nr:gamma-aminobutyrate transaminase POP2 [Cucumis melo var. makuwa]